MVAHRLVCDYVDLHGGVTKVPLTKELLVSVGAARSRYRVFLDQQRARKEGEARTQKRKLAEDYLTDLKKKRTTVQEVCTCLTTEADKLAEEAEGKSGTKMAQLLSKSNALRRASKDKMTELKKVEEEITIKAEELRYTDRCMARLKGPKCTHCLTHQSVLCARLSGELKSVMDKVMQDINFVRGASSTQHRLFRQLVTESEKACYDELLLHNDIKEEFRRITTIPLEHRFLSKLDLYTPKRIALMTTKGGCMGTKLRPLLSKLSQNLSTEARREAVIRALILYLDPRASKHQRGQPEDARASKRQRVQPSQLEEPKAKLQVVKNKDRVFKRSKRPSTAVIPEYTVYRPNAAECVKQSCPNPVDVTNLLLLMYPPTLREITVEMSNLYSTQTKGKQLYLMDTALSQEDTCTSQLTMMYTMRAFQVQMQRNRFDDIMALVHVVDNTKITDDPFFKEWLSVDGSMIPYYSRHGCKQFIKGKPICFVTSGPQYRLPWNLAFLPSPDSIRQALASQGALLGQVRKTLTAQVSQILANVLHFHALSPPRAASPPRPSCKMSDIIGPYSLSADNSLKI
ncbi:PiggyBac transposable element-derived protein 3 [Collichthys lucidus]|uniref:PiggyBac transposable element-derived protein 3 n=1 Tax=Collichthys lucidus TaxID=240159 RepID=A0A4U5U334_COLLU|nr:PiggyBac transposable element-derived protein 3 [Collichthys lucidus]